MLQISQLFVYPIKSLGGIACSSAAVTDRGLQYDRRWMLVDQNNHFMTQRQLSRMALFDVELTPGGLLVRHRLHKDETVVPFTPKTDEILVVNIWEDRCKAVVVDPALDQWFSEQLSMSCRLVYMPDETQREVDKQYAHGGEITSFSDAYPIMMIGQASLDTLNRRLEEPLPINRFRPSIVFTGGSPHEEDSLRHFTINDIDFYGVKLCARCVVTTINQDTGIAGKEPLRTLSGYRQKENKIYFGQNVLLRGAGRIAVGDELKVVERQGANVTM